MSPVPASSRYDVIIVGARVAGASTALLLARRGWRVLALERTARGSDTQSTHALMKSAVFQLQRWGVLDELFAAGVPSIRQTTFHYGDESVVVPLQPTADIPALVAPRRTVLDPILADAARDAGAEIHHETRITSVLRRADGRVIGVTGNAPDGAPFRAHAPLVIGADGTHSLVARAVDSPDQIRGDSSGAVVYAYFGAAERSDDDFAGYEWCYRPGRSAGVMPTNGGILAWIGVAPNRFRTELRADVEAGFWRTLRTAGPEVHDRIAARERTSRFQIFTGAPGYLRRCAGPGWALVGDASHFKDPLATHGITDAVRDAELLALAADEGLNDPEAMPAALARYQQQRDHLSLPLLVTADRLASYEWTMDEVRRLLRELSRGMQNELRWLQAHVADQGRAAGMVLSPASTPSTPSKNEGARP
jgi:2-polyprenyl-6-methoxyphenol hydroxylase-like FAD-dependent oxidoreductase